MLRTRSSLRRSGAYAKRVRILIVDDYEDTRELYYEYLVARGYTCETAADGAEAVAKARTLKPEVIVLDLAMPVMDGWSALRQLRHWPETAQSGIIVVTGQEGAPGDAARNAAVLGADRFFTKPCLPCDLAGAISDVLAQREAEDEPAVASR